MRWRRSGSASSRTTRSGSSASSASHRPSRSTRSTIHCPGERIQNVEGTQIFQHQGAQVVREPLESRMLRVFVVCRRPLMLKELFVPPYTQVHACQPCGAPLGCLQVGVAVLCAGLASLPSSILRLCTAVSFWGFRSHSTKSSPACIIVVFLPAEKQRKRNKRTTAAAV